MIARRIVVEIVGWYGMAALLTSYALVSFDVLLPASIAYQLLNATGALGIVINAVARRAYPPAALNVVWTIIAIVSLIRLIA